MKKKIVVSLLAAAALMMSGATMAKVARVPAEFECKFVENTLVVSGTKLQETRLFDSDGALLSVRQGQFCEFDLCPGEYRLLAKVDNQTKLRKVILYK